MQAFPPPEAISVGQDMYSYQRFGVKRESSITYKDSKFKIQKMRWEFKRTNLQLICLTYLFRKLHCDRKSFSIKLTNMLCNQELTVQNKGSTDYGGTK
ncbi:Protein of unknown function [Gryllus bimaculatus]|nr:Protein of unknown function [Gryllus bimaculatus]